MKEKILLLTSGFLGELTLKELLRRRRFPLVATNPPESMRRRATGNIFSFGADFEIYETSAPEFRFLGEELPEASAAVTLDWKKDFFRNSTPPYPVYHIHPSLLPFYRGYGAVSEQFLRGVCVSGVTAYLENGFADAGPIVYQKKIWIDHSDYPPDFLTKCAAAAASFIIRLMDGEKFKPVPQNEGKAFSLTRTRKRKLIIDFNASAYSVYNFIRAYSFPFSGAAFFWKGNERKALSAAVEAWNGFQGEPGEVVRKTADGLEVACGDGSVIIKEIAGEKPERASLSPIEPGDFVF